MIEQTSRNILQSQRPRHPRRIFPDAEKHLSSGADRGGNSRVHLPDLGT